MSDVTYRCHHCGKTYGYNDHSNEECLSNPQNKTCITCDHYDLGYDNNVRREHCYGSAIKRICKKTDPPRTIDQRTYDGVFEKRIKSVGWMCKEWEPMADDFAAWMEKWKK